MLVEAISQALMTLREQKPLVVNITNYVVMNNTANALLAIGASPIMAHSKQEMAEMMSLADALVINIGTLDSTWVERMRFAVKQANHHGKTVVLDPVGCGASTLRTETSQQLAQLADHLIIRANASEIIALASKQASGKGVDALDSSDVAWHAAQSLVHTYTANVVISGATDYIVTKTQTVQLHNGHVMMPYVTGMGCTLTALTAAFAAVGEDTGLAAAAILGIAGEIAAQQAPGPGSLQTTLLDVLYQLDETTIAQHLKFQISEPKR